MRHALALFAIGCGEREAPAPPPVAVPAPGPVDADLWNTTPVPIDAGPATLCTELDRVAVGKAIGLHGPLVELSNYQLGGPGWGTPGVRVCDWFELGTSLRGFGVELDGNATLDTSPPKPDSVFIVEWRRFDGLGMPAAFGYRPNVVSLQTVANGARVTVEAFEKDQPRAEGERRALAVMRAVLPQLPADATTWIHAQ